MNHLYRLVWSRVANSWVAVAETARGKGKTKNRTGKLAARLTVAAFSATAASFALPSFTYAANAADATVTAGSGNVTTVGTTTTINQTSQGLALDWTSLSTAANEALIFRQPNASAIALNRITGSNPSEMLGSLTANGQVFILNPNGVLFGAGSQVNVGGLVASTMSLSNADFEAGSFNFSGSGAGAVVNQGTMTAAAGGYLALLAPEVRNEGVMLASLGTALLAAGNKVTLSLDNGSLLGYSIDQGAINALAENRQLIQANGGQVLLSAKALDSLTSATVNNTGIIEAKTIQNKAGRILLMGDMASGTVNVAGTLDASAPNADGMGGNGGFIETSAAKVKVAEGTKVLALAANGTSGKWLVDPKDFIVAATGGDMTGATLSTNLGTANVELQSSGGGTPGGGNINVNDAVSWSANTLTLTAAHDINVNAVMSATGSAGLALNTSTANGADTSVAGGKVNMALGAGGFSGRVDLATGTSLRINNQAYTIINSLGAQGSSSGTDLQGMSTSGRYVLGSNIDASATTTWNGGLGFKPIGATSSRFTGTFDGLGHTINQLFINRPTEQYIGLFGAVQGTVRNAGVTGGQVTGLNIVGGMIGYAISSSISNLFSSNTVTSGTDYDGNGTGGLIGNAQLGTVSNSYSAGMVTGDPAGVAVGGLIGTNSSTLTDSYSTATVAGNQWVGGLTGINSGTIMRSYASGNVRGLREVGGLTGALVLGTISDSYSINAQISGIRNVGGLVGYAYANSRIINSYSAATYIAVSSGLGGGLIGLMDAGSSATNVYSTTDVRGASGPNNGAYGGLIGSNGGTITNAYSSGKVVGNLAAGFAGNNFGTITGGYWNVDTSLQVNGASFGAGDMTGLSAAGMKTSSSFAGWSIASTGASSAVWRIYEGQTAPLLRSFLTPATLADAVVTYNGVAQTGASVGAIGTAASGRNVGTYASGLYSNQQGYDFSGGSLTINPVAVTLAANLVSKTYDGTTSANTSAYIVGGRFGLYGSDTLTGGTFTFDDKNAGAGKRVYSSGVTINDGNGGANYAVSYGVSQAGTITQAGLTVKATDVTKTYDGGVGANSSLALVSGTVFSGDVLGGGNFTFADKNAGTGKTVLTSGVTVSDGNSGGNYNITYVANTGSTINQANLAVTGITAQDKVYDSTLSATLGGTATVAALGSDAVSVGGNGTGVFSGKNAGNGKSVTVSGYSLAGADALNYKLVQPTGLSANISKANLTLAAVTDSKTYDGTTASTVAVVATGLMGSDSATAAQSFGNKNVLGAGGSALSVNAGYALNDGNSGNNYNVTLSAATGTINKATLNVTGVVAENKTYDGSSAATLSSTGSLNGLVGGEALVLSPTGAAFDDKNAGIGKTVTATYGLADGAGGGLAGNYQMAPVTATANIARLGITVTATTDNKTYDGTTAGTSALASSGVLTGDVVNFSGSTLFADKDVGTAKAVTIAGISASGADESNYSFNATAGSIADISKASLNIIANNDNSTAGGVAYIGGNGVSYSGFATGENASVLTGTLAYGGSSQGASTAGSYAITPGGYSADNYTIGYVNGVLSIRAGGLAEAALGGSALVTAYGSALQAKGGFGAATIGSNSSSDSSNTGSDAATLAAAATAASDISEDK
jgi:filamentous hemagglutinin family protein